jgi:hypothetical protein
MTARPYQLRQAGYTRSVDAFFTMLEVLAFLIGSTTALMMLVRRVTIARHDAVAPVQELSLGAADAMLRSTQVRAIAAAVGVALLIAGGWQVHVHVVALFSVAFAFALQSYLNAWRVRCLIGLPRASAELRGTTLTGCSDGTHASVIVSVKAAASAREHAVPRAIIY